MPPKKIRTRAIERSKYVIYPKKAQDFYQTMQLALGEGNWNSAGLEAVHCAISATDAILAYSGGLRCASPDHSDAIRLLRDTITTPEALQNSKRLTTIIGMKNRIEYEARNFTRKEAEEIAEHTERYFDWIRSILPRE